MGKNHEQGQGQVQEGNTMTEPKKVDPKAEAKKQARKEARERIVKFLEENKDQLGGLKSDIESFIGKGGERGKRTATRSINTELLDAIKKAGDAGLSELDIFRQFKIGRPEMVTKMRIFVLTPNADDRVWVKFFEADERYKVVGLGANPPEGWNGYVPGTKVSL